MVVTVRKIGGSVAVVIPKGVAKDMGLSVGTALDISQTENSIVMRKRGRRPRRPLKELLKQISSKSYRQHTKELGSSPVGKELW
jgi:antitoxin component of MazEF toxin-antitoxin module